MGVLIGYTILFNVGIILAHQYLDRESTWSTDIAVAVLALANLHSQMRGNLCCRCCAILCLPCTLLCLVASKSSDSLAVPCCAPLDAVLRCLQPHGCCSC